MNDGKIRVQLSWEQSDPERKLGFKGARHTGVNMTFSFMVALLLSVAFYGGMYPVTTSQVGAIFYDRGPIPAVIVFLSAWSIAILFIKWRKLALQRRVLRMQVVPQKHGFALTPATAHTVLEKIYQLVDHPKHFVLFNRIEVAISNLKNVGLIGDVDAILRSQAEHDESSMESSYTMLKGFVWAIPVLGFIGTVLGLSQAIGSFGAVLGASADVSQIKAGLGDVTAGLSTAFDTTFIALVFALIIQLLMTAVKKKEEDFLDESVEYCLRYVVGRLRLTNNNHGAQAATRAKAQEGDDFSGE